MSFLDKSFALRKLANGISEDQDFKLFWGRIPPNPLAARPFSARMKKINILILPTHKVGQSEINIYLLTHKTWLLIIFINFLLVQCMIHQTKEANFSGQIGTD